jgi:hypothetical protein
MVPLEAGETAKELAISTIDGRIAQLYAELSKRRG